MLLRDHRHRHLMHHPPPPRRDDGTTADASSPASERAEVLPRSQDRRAPDERRRIREHGIVQSRHFRRRIEEWGSSAASADDRGCSLLLVGDDPAVRRRRRHPLDVGVPVHLLLLRLRLHLGRIPRRAQRTLLRSRMRTDTPLGARPVVRAARQLPRQDTSKRDERPRRHAELRRRTACQGPVPHLPAGSMRRIDPAARVAIRIGLQGTFSERDRDATAGEAAHALLRRVAGGRHAVSGPAADDGISRPAAALFEQRRVNGCGQAAARHQGRHAVRGGIGDNYIVVG